MMTEDIVYIAALAVIGVSCLSGVFVNKFDDNLMQRIGLAVACIGATVRMLDTLDIIEANNNARYLMTYGVAVFCIGTTIKFWRR